MNDHADFEMRVAFRARVLCRTAEPHHAAEARPCHAHSEEARRQLTSPAVASSVPDSFRRGIGADDGAAGLRVLASAGLTSTQPAPPSNEHRLVVRSDEPAEWATAIAREGA